MSRTQRLFDLMQILRRRRFPVPGAVLAEELGVSLRTLYRDIGALQKQGADIQGEAGLGYVLKPGFLLPPLMFTEDELEALILGSRWVAERGDSRLSAAADDVLAKVSAIIPKERNNPLENNTLVVRAGEESRTRRQNLADIRRAIRTEHKLDMVYVDLKGVESRRTVWPVILGFFEQVNVVGAWCELRGGFRNFRVDRISSLTVSGQTYPQRRHELMRQWRRHERLDT